MKFWMKAFVIVPALCLAGSRQPRNSRFFPATDWRSGGGRRKEGREKKKDAAKPKKVYTDDDLKGSVPAPEAAATSARQMPVERRPRRPRR